MISCVPTKQVQDRGLGQALQLAVLCATPQDSGLMSPLSDNFSKQTCILFPVSRALLRSSSLFSLQRRKLAHFPLQIHLLCSKGSKHHLILKIKTLCCQGIPTWSTYFLYTCFLSFLMDTAVCSLVTSQTPHSCARAITPSRCHSAESRY